MHSLGDGCLRRPGSVDSPVPLGFLVLLRLRGSTSLCAAGKAIASCLRACTQLNKSSKKLFASVLSVSPWEPAILRAHWLEGRCLSWRRQEEPDIQPGPKKENHSAGELGGQDTRQTHGATSTLSCGPEGACWGLTVSPDGLLVEEDLVFLSCFCDCISTWGFIARSRPSGAQETVFREAP